MNWSGLELSNKNDNCHELATGIRIHCLKMTNRAKCSHIGSCLSVTDLLAVLYGRILNVNPSQIDWSERDRFVLSKGHAAAAIYATLAERGFFPMEWLERYYLDGSKLPGHISHSVPGVEVSAGSLGHGLSISCGMALASKLEGKSYRVFTVLSDGELDEGSTWEAVLFAPHHHLDNLVAIVDYNKIQGFGFVKEVLDLEPLADKWRSFGWSVREINGHDMKEIEESLSTVPLHPEKPTCIIAHTVKGKGVSFMENQLAWHYQYPDDNQLRQALSELEVSN